MTHTEATPQPPDPTTPTPAPDPTQPPTRQEPAPPPDTPRNQHHDSVVLIALLATCAGIYLIVGEHGFAGVITAVAGLYGTLRMRR
ncbi:hypothetical protein ACFWSF_30470 [Streptomyces sp. NPDC058611]|uniref:hypothetical protein n=1 Tax=unclassified Streptomyces TaxID=2593676 RepID=UPI00366953F9